MIGRRWLCGVFAVVGVLALAPASWAKQRPAERPRDYQVTISNLATGQPFSPPIMATVPQSGTIFKLGSPSSFELKEIAENGNNGPMLKALQARRLAGTIFDMQASPTPLVPAGKPGSQPNAPAPCAGGCPNAWTMRIRADRRDKLSWVAMLVCTNDGFTGVDGIKLPPKVGGSVTAKSPAYDTGTEKDTENFVDIMPPCQSLIGVRSSTGAPGTAMSNPALAEGGVVGLHAGIQGGHDLDPAVHGWTGSVGQVTVTRVR